MPEQELNGAQVLRAPIDQRCLRATHGMRAVGRRVKSDLLDPGLEQALILARRNVLAPTNAARKQKVAAGELRLRDPGSRALARLLGQLELHGTLRLLLHHDGTLRDGVSLGDIADPKFHQVAAT
jgi:hypothetical protein